MLRTKPGGVLSDHSSVVMPPMEPPITAATEVTPSERRT